VNVSKTLVRMELPRLIFTPLVEPVLLCQARTVLKTAQSLYFRENQPANGL